MGWGAGGDGGLGAMGSRGELPPPGGGIGNCGSMGFRVGKGGAAPWWRDWELQICGVPGGEWGCCPLVVELGIAAVLGSRGGL